MRKTAWRARTSRDTVCRRASGRRYHAMRTLTRQLRMREVAHLLAAWGWGYGVQARIARQLGGSEATISRDIAELLPLVEACPHCGGLTPRAWWDD